MLNRRNVLLATASTAFSLAGGTAGAQGSKHLTRLVVGFPPGGTVDVLARVIAQKLHKDTAPVLVENKPGAGGRLAVVETKNAPADGKTVLMTADPILVMYPHIFKNLAYNTLTDITPVAPLASDPCCLVVGPLVPDSVKTLADFIAWCKKNPTQASYATAAAGTTMHFLGSILAREADMAFTHIPHRGGAAAVQDVMGGQIASSMTTVGQVFPFLAAGKLRVLALSSEKRLARLPQVPTFVELGFKPIQALVYYGAYVRAGTPAAQVVQLSETFNALAKSPEMLATLDRLALDPFTLSPEKFAERVRSDLDHWGPIIQRSGYSVDE
ncbi:MAG: tripartite tricarboxylate transporter substrate-binding protein [Burkholderiaceae bacterium]|nr:tripartite tricarboxylate transporter substrate-binding protein [Burkholderiaceae bacterium]